MTIQQLSASVFIDAEGKEWVALRMKSQSGAEVTEATYHLSRLSENHFVSPPNPRPSYREISYVIRETSPLKPVFKDAILD